MTASPGKASDQLLKRELGVFQSMMLGLGSILGTGVFVSIGIAAGVAGHAVLPAIACAAILAICNGISSAQLASAHPVSGGTYEYGYRLLGSRLGFTAGWMFMFAKSASAATAALGLAGYLAQLIGGNTLPSMLYSLTAVIILACVALTGIKRASYVNSIVVSITLVSLLAFILGGFEHSTPSFQLLWSDVTAGVTDTPTAFFEAIALIFVAYTGYGRIATLGEEVRDPRRTIPKSILTTLFLAMFLYIFVAVAAISAVGSTSYATFARRQVAPLIMIAEHFDNPTIVWTVTIGGITALIGVLLNLVLGLSRVLLAMGRRRDVPQIFGRVHERSGVPGSATMAVAVIISSLVIIGDVKLTWSFSAFSVLMYYALTNLCALRLTEENRMYPKWISVAGLLGCVFLTFWIDPQVLVAGIGVIVVGNIWKSVINRLHRRVTTTP
ncbi:MAG: APC family permease [Planctomycetota bacterium]|nr:APC family permease [Planctomycetota bacterium]